MKIVEPGIEVLTDIDGDKILKQIERAARTCYRSEDRITTDSSSARKIVKALIDRGHEAVIEFADITVKVITDIGAQRDISRHRHTSHACESTRYNAYNKDKYGGEISVIKPCNLEENSQEYIIWKQAMENAEKSYLDMAALGCKPDQMRMMLPLSTKTEFCIKANIREWRHIFMLRCSPAAHPSVQEVMKMILAEFKAKIPVVFDDLEF